MVPDADRRIHSFAANSSIVGSRTTRTCNGRDHGCDHCSLALATPILLLQAAAERRAIEERAGLATAAIAHIVEREVAASLALLDGLASTPSLHSGDHKSLYEQFAATKIAEGAFLSAYDDERQIINTLRPFGAPLPYIKDFPPEAQAAVERIHRNGWSVSGRTWGIVAGAYVVVISRSVLSNGKRFIVTTAIPEARLQALVKTQEVPADCGRFVLDRYGRALVGERVQANPQSSASRSLDHPTHSAIDQRGSLTVTDVPAPSISLHSNAPQILAGLQQ